MIVFILIIVAMFTLFCAREIRKESKRGILRECHTGSPPLLYMGHGMRYHLFLSHVWQTAQDRR